MNEEELRDQLDACRGDICRLRGELEEAQAAIAEMTELLGEVPSPPYPFRRGANDYQRWQEGQKRALANEAGRAFLDRLRKAEEVPHTIDEWLDGWMEKNEHDFPARKDNPVVQRVQILAHICHSAIGSRDMAQRICLEQQKKAEKAERERDEAQAEAAAMGAVVYGASEAVRTQDTDEFIKLKNTLQAFTELGSHPSCTFLDRLEKAEEREAQNWAMVTFAWEQMSLIVTPETGTIREPGDFEQEVTDVLTRFKYMKAHAEKAERDRDGYRKQVEDFDGAREKAERERGEFLQELVLTRNELPRYQEGIKIVSDKRDKALARVKELEGELGMAETGLRNCSEMHEDVVQQKLALEKRVEELEGEAVKRDRALHEARGDNGRLEKECANLLKRHDLIQAECACLHRRNTGESTIEAFKELREDLLQLSRSYEAQANSLAVKGDEHLAGCFRGEALRLRTAARIIKGRTDRLERNTPAPPKPPDTSDVDMMKDAPVLFKGSDIPAIETPSTHTGDMRLPNGDYAAKAEAGSQDTLQERFKRALKRAEESPDYWVEQVCIGIGERYAAKAEVRNLAQACRTLFEAISRRSSEWTDLEECDAMLTICKLTGEDDPPTRDDVPQGEGEEASNDATH